MENKKVMTSRGEVVDIGEITVHKSDQFLYEIPRLSYIVIKEDENTYASTCIDLHIDGDGTTPYDAKKNMGENVSDFLSANFTNNRGDGPAWDHLKELAEIDENTKETWDAFSKVKLDLAKQGKKTDVISKVMKHVSELKDEIEKLKKINTNKERDMKRLEQVLAETEEELKSSTIKLQYLEMYSAFLSEKLKGKFPVLT